MKDLRYQQRLLRELWPDVVGAQAAAAQDLAELLGDDHDLAVLSEQIVRLVPLPPSAAEAAARIAPRRAELQQQASLAGRRIYAESPKRFGRRMRAYLAVGEAVETASS